MRCGGNNILSEISDRFTQLEEFDYDARYDYVYDYIIVGNTLIDVLLRSYSDKGVGWWFPGEPARGYHFSSPFLYQKSQAIYKKYLKK